MKRAKDVQAGDKFYELTASKGRKLMRQAKRVQAGDKFYELTAVMKVDVGMVGNYWLFHCDCGGEKVVRVGNVRRGNTKSCGCRARRRNAASRARRIENLISAACEQPHGDFPHVDADEVLYSIGRRGS